MSHEFFERYLPDVPEEEEQKYPTLSNEFIHFNPGTFNAAGFEAAYVTTVQHFGKRCRYMHNTFSGGAGPKDNNPKDNCPDDTYHSLKKSLESKFTIQQEPKNHLYQSITFTSDKYCTRTI